MQKNVDLLSHTNKRITNLHINFFVFPHTIRIQALNSIKLLNFSCVLFACISFLEKDLLIRCSSCMGRPLPLVIRRRVVPSLVRSIWAKQNILGLCNGNIPNIWFTNTSKHADTKMD